MTQAQLASVAWPRLVLGTAQLAMPYGILERSERDAEGRLSGALTLLDVAESLGICALDTAAGYGMAEQVIGDSTWGGEVWTKLDPLLPPEESVVRSLGRLDRERIDVLFVHDVNDFLSSSRAAIRSIERLRDGRIARLGISAYEPSDVVRAMELLEFDVVQLPFNVFDPRLEVAVSNGELPGSCSYVARSVFLQGVLARPIEAASKVPPQLRIHVVHWAALCKDLEVLPGEAALTWALSRPFLDSVIVGADNVHQLQEIIGWCHSPFASRVLESIEAEDLWPLSDPRQWE